MVALLNTSSLFSETPGIEDIDLVRDENGKAILFESFTEAEIYRQKNSIESVHLIGLDFNASVYLASEHLQFKTKHMEL